MHYYVHSNSHDSNEFWIGVAAHNSGHPGKLDWHVWPHSRYAISLRIDTPFQTDLTYTSKLYWWFGVFKVSRQTSDCNQCQSLILTHQSLIRLASRVLYSLSQLLNSLPKNQIKVNFVKKVRTETCVLSCLWHNSNITLKTIKTLQKLPDATRGNKN